MRVVLSAAPREWNHFGFEEEAVSCQQGDLFKDAGYDVRYGLLVRTHSPSLYSVLSFSLIIPIFFCDVAVSSSNHGSLEACEESECIRVGAIDVYQVRSEAVPKPDA